jgi:glutamate N-acetyltransferase/amino-acid N-acetyltransferase
MSTNDTVIVLANGQSGARSLARPSEHFNKFCCALNEVCLELAKMIVLDAEGATKFIEVLVRGAKNPDEARALAFSVANSNLFKCAMFGSDPNWGRIAAALGSVSSCLKWEKMDISLNNRFVFKSGKPVVLKDKGFLKAKNIVVCVDLNQGRSQARVYTSDLSYDYVKINADYN